MFRTLPRLHFLMATIAAGSVLMMVQGSWNTVGVARAFWSEATSRNAVGYVVDGPGSLFIAMVLTLFGNRL